MVKIDVLYVLRDRRPKNHICRNCKYIVAKVETPRIDDDNISLAEATRIMRETARVMKITHESDFHCTFNPEWIYIHREDKHFCGQFLIRANWQLGYQDIERIWEEVDRVYETRRDCKLVPEGVRRRKAA